jgi:hypothetical protein
MVLEVQVKDIHAPVVFLKDRWVMKKVGRMYPRTKPEETLGQLSTRARDRFIPGQQ